MTRLNLIVIRAADVERTTAFYRRLGLSFERETHGTGPAHFAAVRSGLVFEIYPASTTQSVDVSTRLGFEVVSVDAAVEAVREAGGEVLNPPAASAWGYRGVVADPDGRRVELVQALPESAQPVSVEAQSS